jgi:hypothetical protein
LLAGAFTAAQGIRYSIDHPYFSVREVAVHGTKRLSASWVRTWLGMVEGRSIWRVSPRALERRLEDHPEILEARVRRSPPNALAVEVVEREARAVLHDAHGFFLIDDSGVAFRAATPTSGELPIITIAPAGAGPAAGPGDADQLSPRVLGEAVRVAHLLVDGQGTIGVSEVVIRGGRATPEIVVFSRDGQLIVELGWGRWDEKLGALARVLGHARKARSTGTAESEGPTRDASLAGTIDARDPEVVVARWSHQGTA